MVGYWENPEATTRRIRNGWLDTGDRAEQLPDGSIRILGVAMTELFYRQATKLILSWSNICCLKLLRSTTLFWLAITKSL